MTGHGAVIARWAGWDGSGLEHCLVARSDRGLHLEGVVAGVRGGLWGCHYRVDTDARLATREVRLAYTGGLALHLRADGEGHWQDAVTGADLPALDGCLDVDIGATPATNTLPILRLGLATGESREITAAYVPLPGEIAGDLVARPVSQRYTCLIRGARYRYEGLFRAFSATLEIDAHCLVRDYPDTFRRVV